MRGAPTPALALAVTLLSVGVLAAPAEWSHVQVWKTEGPKPASPPRNQVETIDINRASPAELQRLPGIGPALSRRIVESRRALGPFPDVADLARVRGIGPRSIARWSGRIVTRSQPREEP